MLRKLYFGKLKEKEWRISYSNNNYFLACSYLVCLDSTFSVRECQQHKYHQTVFFSNSFNILLYTECSILYILTLFSLFFFLEQIIVALDLCSSFPPPQAAFFWLCIEYHISPPTNGNGCWLVGATG